MKFRHYFLSFLWFLVPSSTASAQSYPLNEEWRWVRFTTESGLPSNEVTHVVETEDGTVWAGTSKGLAWFDGYEWKKPIRPEGIPEGPVLELYARGDELLAHIGDRLYYGRGHDLLQVPVEGVHQAVILGQDSLIIRKGDSLFTYTGGTLSPMEHSPPIESDDSRVKNFGLVMTRGGIWLDAIEGLCRFDGRKWERKITGPPAASARLAIQYMAEDEYGNAYASIGAPGERRGLWSWKRDTPPALVPFPYLNLGVPAVDLGPRGDFIACYPQGTNILRRGNGWSTLPGRKRAINFLRFRKNGDLWFGSPDGLFLFRQTSTRWTFLKRPGPDLKSRGNEIMVSRGGSFFLASAGGVEICRPGEEPTIIPGGPKQVTGLAEDSAGNIWASSGAAFDGVYRWDGARWTHYPVYSDPNGARFHKIRKDRSGKLWFLGMHIQKPFGQSDGPGAFQLENGKFIRWGVPEGLLSGRVYAFEEGPDGALWFGTEGGLSRWKDGSWRHWTRRDGLSSDHVFAIAIDHRNRVWLSHRGWALGYIDETEKVSYVGPNQEIWDIKVDSADRVWFSTITSVGCYQNGRMVTLRPSFGIEDFTLWPILPVGGKIYVGTSGRGAAILDSKDLDQPLLQVSIEKPLIEGNTLFLRWRATAFWGDPAPGELLTRYQLDGGDWSPWSVSREITLKDVGSGDHTAWVQAQQPFGEITPERVGAAFAVPFPFYFQPAFFIPVGALSGGTILLGGIILRRRRRHLADLRKSELKFRRLTEATFEGVIIHENGILLEANPSALRMFGYELNEIAGRHVLEFAAEGSHEVIKKNILAPGEEPYEIVGLKKDGTQIVVEVMSNSLPYDQKVVRVVSIRDITHRKEWEARSLSYQKQLRSLASELTLTNERERRRMAAYLHDTIGQTLAFCKIKVGGLNEHVSDAEGRKTLLELRGLLDQSIHGTRSLTFELSPPILNELGFEAAVEWLVERMRLEHDLVVRLTLDGNKYNLDEDVRYALFSALRELLINVVKHSHALSASLSIQQVADNLELRVADEGTGFDPAGLTHRVGDESGFGLFNVKERIQSIGGTIKINSSIGGGTRVTLLVPSNPISKTSRMTS
jgi:PAS domain S-box-containing protein